MIICFQEENNITLTPEEAHTALENFANLFIAYVEEPRDTLVSGVPRLDIYTN